MSNFTKTTNENLCDFRVATQEATSVWSARDKDKRIMCSLWSYGLHGVLL